MNRKGKDTMNQRDKRKTRLKHNTLACFVAFLLAFAMPMAAFAESGENEGKVNSQEVEATTLDCADALDGEDDSSNPSKTDSLLFAQAASGSLTPLAGEPPLMNGLAWKLVKASDDSEPSRDKGPNPADYSVGIPHWQEYYVVLDFDIHAYSGEQLHEGDRLSIPFLPHYFYYATTAKEQLMAPDGITVLGTWWIDADTETLEIELGVASEGFTVLNNCTITTAKTIRANRVTTVDEVLATMIGGVSHDYLYLVVPRSPSSYAISKVLNVTTNTTARWHIYTSRDLTDQLYLNDGNSLDFHNQTSLIIEDEIPASQGITAIGDFRAVVNVLNIMSETDKRSATIEGSHALASDVTSAFTRVAQSGGEDYDTFKSRINPMEYGVYETPGGDFKVVANLGNASSPSYPLKIANIWPDLEQSLLNNGRITPAEIAIVANALRSTNVIHGNATDIMFGFTVTYQQAFTDTVKTNTVTGSFVRNGNVVTRSSTRTATLKTGSAIAAPASYQAKIAKADAVSGDPLENVVFKIQHSTDGGTSWIDTSYADVTTGPDGQATTGVLSPGLYRFKEVSGLDGYDTTNVGYVSSTLEANGMFTIDAQDQVGVVVTATNTPKQYTVRYNTDGGGTIAAKTGVLFWDNNLLPAANPTKPGYTFSHWEVEDSGASETYKGDTATSAKKYSEMADDADTAEITLVAIWSGKTYTVNYDTNGGDPSSITPLSGVLWADDNLLPATNPTKPGSTFLRWIVSNSGTTGTYVGVTATATSAYSSLADGDTTMAITLEAQWADKTYTVNYDTNGGDPSSITPLSGVLWADDNLLPAMSPTKNSFVFSHWEVNDSGSAGSNVGVVATSASTYSSLADDDNTMAIELIAVWTPKSAEVEVLPTITKTLVGILPASEVFVFEISLISGDATGIVLPVSTATTASMTSGSGVANFSNISFSKVGSYTLEITEVAGTTSDLDYDSAVYEITYTVTEDALGYVVSGPVITKDTLSALAVEFVNNYTPQNPSMDFIKSADKNTVSPGDTLTYTIRLVNTGNTDLQGIIVKDPLDARVSFVSADNGGKLETIGGKSTAVWFVPELKVGQSLNLKLIVKINSDASTTSGLYNTAFANDDPSNTTETKLTGPGALPKTGESLVNLAACTAVLVAASTILAISRKKRKASDH